ncbi:MAG: putative selenate reductase subunit YgfK [Eubacteriales bacterium]
MSDKMTTIPFPKLMEWILEEKHTKGTVFGIQRPYQADANHYREFFGGKLEMPFGPAAGPHTQLAQNLVAAYYAGSRFFELKTVQIIDGDDLPVSKPCIGGDDELYNVEWSTELYIPQAMDEYVKAWIAIHVIAKEFNLGAMDGFQFNMSVGYDLDGIRSAKIDTFIEGLKDAGQTRIYKESMAWLKGHAGLFRNFKEADLAAISPKVSNSVTLSTLHGCPPLEIERIARYLLDEKKVNTFVKCNPTLLGYEYARNTLDDLGYRYLSFDDMHFKNDLQYSDAVPMLKRLKEAAAKQNLEFGVKITNTFPVDIREDELPGKEMYMSGKALYPLSMAVAAKLSADFDGDLRISYSGGADYFNIEKIVAAGIWPVTMATTILKPGGYQRLGQLAGVFGKQPAKAFSGVDTAAAEAIVAGIKSDRHYVKALKPLGSRKMDRNVPLIDCFIAPCQVGCPIGQDIPAYLKLVEEGKMKEALQVILEKNPLPFITGTICPHNCMSKCTRNFYESPVSIRSAKLSAAKGGYASLLPELKKPSVTSDRKAAVVGGGPGGMAAAFFLAKGGMAVTIFEKQEKLGGVVRYAIPGFRIPEEAIDNDISLIMAMGVKVVTGHEVTSIDELKKDFDYVVLALGASLPGVLRLEKGQAMNALDFLAAFNKQKGNVDAGKNIAVIGGGNTAMDTARAAKKTKGVEKVTIVYRRTNRYMPAAEEELLMALADGVEFRELLVPLIFQNGILACRNMKLGEMDASGRRGVVETDEISYIDADTVISAVGEQVPEPFYRANGLKLSNRGRLAINYETLETSIKGIYAVGDGLYGPASVVEAIRDSRKVAEDILGKPVAYDNADMADPAAVYKRKGVLAEEEDTSSENSRCLSCSSICENCVEVCPNRANISIKVPGMDRNQIIHVDSMCNECGNCRTFCPYDSAPYLEKFTLFADDEAMESSKNKGFTVYDRTNGNCRIRMEDRIFDYIPKEESDDVPDNIKNLIAAVIAQYEYLL